MFNTIEEYLEALKNEMQGGDSALLQDALADAREHLSTALAVAREKNADLKESDALKTIVDEYGTPEETASAYKEVERRTSPSLKQTAKPQSWFVRFFGVYADARAWGALLYMLIAFVTGVFYFTWAVTGLSLSISFAIFIFGLPFALLFLLSVRGLASARRSPCGSPARCAHAASSVILASGYEVVRQAQGAPDRQIDLVDAGLHVRSVCAGHSLFCGDCDCVEHFTFIYCHSVFAGNSGSGCSDDE